MANKGVEEKINEILSRGVREFIDPDDVFRNKLLKKARGEYEKDIVIKLGADPNRPDIHLGHAVILRKLRQLQDIGCKVIFIVGDFTATIGDPSGKNKVRPEVTQKEVRENMKTYVDQVGIILRDDPTLFAWLNNFDWFINVTDLTFPKEAIATIKSQSGEIKLPANSFIGKAARFDQITKQKQFNKSITNITLRTFISTLKQITHSRLIARDMFQDRLEKGEELYMHEMMYPVLQGIDSYVISQIFGSCDMEVGGTDQTFNMLMGRDVMKMNGKLPQSVLSFDLLVGLDGKEKMSKSLDNYIGITDEPNLMYGKVMSLPDDLIPHYFTLATYTPEAEIEKLKTDLERGKIHPKDLKMRLAREIVTIYHGEKKASESEKSFINTFQKGEIPEDCDEVSVKGNDFAESLVEFGVVSSKTDYRRLIESGAVSNMNTGEKITDPAYIPKKSEVIRVGKKRFIKIV